MERDRHTGEPIGGRPGDTAYEAAGQRGEGADGDAPRRRGNRHHTSRRKGRYKQQAAARPGSNGAHEPERPTTSQMRDARASGRTPGISTADEPAAVPLGTDDEAAGAPPPAEAVQQEVDRADQGRGMQGLSAEEAMSGRPGHPEESPRAFGKIVTISAAVLIVLVLLALLF